MSQAGSKKEAKQVHTNFVLKLLNTGTQKDLQMLPLVGIKTAYQIVTYRCLNGKFKSFKDVEKSAIWRGKTWKRFKNVC